MPNSDPRTTHVPDTCAGRRLDAVLAELFPEYSRSRLSAWIKSGDVTVDGAQQRGRDPVRGGETIVLNAVEEVQTHAVAEDIPLTILYEDEHVFVLDKPAGLVVHPGAGNPAGTLVNALLHRDPALDKLPRAGIVHRLDKDTSGVMVVARTLVAHTALVAQLSAREVHRQYLAVVFGALVAGGTANLAIDRHPRDRLRMAVREDGKDAVTHYRLRERFRSHTALECRLETGRTHQIRVHMAHINHPLAGDQVYNGKPRLLPEALRDALEEFNRQALHAARLALVHPGTGKSMLWKAPLPDDMNYLLECMRADIEGTDMPDDLDDDDWNEDDYDVEVIYHP
jgi:23S rRNA pseudouridine1911/1915/1917 synthase